MKQILAIAVTLAAGAALLGCDQKLAEKSSSSLASPGNPAPKRPATDPGSTSTGTQDKPGSASPPSGGATGISTASPTPK